MVLVGPVTAGVVPRVAAVLPLLAGKTAEGVGPWGEDPLEAFVDTTLISGKQLLLEAGAEDMFCSGDVTLGYVFAHFVYVKEKN